MYLDGYRKEITAWVAEGLSDRAIADQVRVSPSTVRYWRERNGILRPARRTETSGRKQREADAAPDQEDSGNEPGEDPPAQPSGD